MRILCHDIPDRRVGSEGNRAAKDFFEAITSSFGFEIESPTFNCTDYHQEAPMIMMQLTNFAQ